MDEIEQSILMGKVFRFIATGFQYHDDKFVQMSIYKDIDRQVYLICISEGLKGTENIEGAYSNLGGYTPGILLAPYAQRKISDERKDKKLDYKMFKETMTECGFPLKWMV